MMKLDSILILTIMLNSNAFAVETKPAPAAVPVYGEVKEKGQLDPSGTNATLAKLLSVKGVDAQYKKCLAANKDALDKIPNCIWNGNGTSDIVALDDKIKKDVTKMYELESAPKDGRAPASSSSPASNLVNKSKQISVDYMSDPAVIELSKMFEKKLQEAMLGDAKAQAEKDKIAIVDHKKYIELYRTELGKTIISAFTSYCIATDTDPSEIKDTVKDSCVATDGTKIPCKLYFLGADREKAIKKNIDSLKTADLTGTSSASHLWQGCILSVSNVCYADKTDVNGVDPQVFKDSQKEACIITDYVKSARVNLIAANAQIESYEKIGSGTSLEIDNLRKVIVTDKNSIDAASTVTSKDIEDKFEVANKKMVDEMDKCIKDKTIINKDSCKNYISTDTDEKEKSLTEFGVRQYALGDALDEKLKDKAEVEKYLKAEGYSEAKIKAMTKDKEELKTLVDEIKVRYKNEREAIIAAMADKVQGHITEKNGAVTTATVTDADRLVKIKKDLADRADDYKELVHFNNIVSSYLEIESKEGKTRNVASLYAEMDNGAKKIKDVSVSPDEAKNLKAAATKAGLDKDIGKGQNGGTNLDVETLNKLLKYSNEK